MVVDRWVVFQPLHDLFFLKASFRASPSHPSKEDALSCRLMKVKRIGGCKRQTCPLCYWNSLLIVVLEEALEVRLVLLALVKALVLVLVKIRGTFRCCKRLQR